MSTIVGRTILTATLVFVPLAGFPDTLRLTDGRQISGQYEGGSSRVIRFRTDSGVIEYDVLTVSGVRIWGAAPAGDRETSGDRVASFGRDQERIIRDWFSNRSNLSGLPPGLARRESLPPGLARQVQRNGTLPPGLERRVQPFPADLERRLPRLLDGLRRVVLGRDVLVVESATARIVDLLRDVW